MKEMNQGKGKIVALLAVVDFVVCTNLAGTGYSMIRIQMRKRSREKCHFHLGVSLPLLEIVKGKTKCSCYISV